MPSLQKKPVNSGLIAKRILKPFSSQASATRLLTEGTPWKVLVSFAAPIFLSQLFQQLYNTADSWIVGNYLGKEALAAVNSSGSLIFLLISFFVGASMGAGVVISRCFGAGRAACHTGDC